MVVLSRTGYQAPPIGRSTCCNQILSAKLGVSRKLGPTSPTWKRHSKKIALAKDPRTASGRPIRDLVVKYYVFLYGKGDTRTMFDTINTFLKFDADAILTDKDSSKV